MVLDRTTYASLVFRAIIVGTVLCHSLVPWAWLIPFFFSPLPFLILFVRVKLTRPNYSYCPPSLFSTTFNQNVVDPRKHIPESNGEQKETNHSGNKRQKKKKRKEINIKIQLENLYIYIYQIPGGFFRKLNL